MEKSEPEKKEEEEIKIARSCRRKIKNLKMG